MQNLGIWSEFGFGFALKHLENISERTIPTTLEFWLLLWAQWKYLNNCLRELFLTTILKRELI